MSEEKTDLGTRNIGVGKVVLNIGVGRSGEAIQRGKKVLEDLTGQKASQRRAKKTIRDFGTHKGEPIGIVVTVRGQQTQELIKKLLASRDNKLATSSFDSNGSVSFGVKEHIEIPGVKYDPEIGIFGMNVSVLLQRPGYRVARRMRRSSSVGKFQRVTGDEAQEFFKLKYGATIE
jgi:large subunit ribosomal protein L5